MKHGPKHETGQSIVIIAIVLVAFAALAAIVVDVGNSYVQNRKIQNATDAAAMAGSLALAQRQSHGGVANAVENYIRRNAPDITGFSAYYVVEDAAGATHILNGAGDKSLIPMQWSADLRPPDKIACGVTCPTALRGVSMTVVGVYVDANKRFDTFFAKAIGFTQVTVLGSAKGNIKGGICSATNVFPVVVDETKAFPVGTDGKPVIHYESTEPTYEYSLAEDYPYGTTTVEGPIQYVTWSWAPASGDTSGAGLVSNMNDTSRSGKVEVTSTTNPGLPGSVGLMRNTAAVKSAWTARIGGAPVTLPVFDTTSGGVYHIVGFASFKVTGVVNGSSTTPYKVTGKFQEWVDPQARGGCADFGVSSVTENPPPTNLKRTLAGSVTFLPVVPNAQPQTTKLSADVVFVMDNSGSMNYAFGGGDSTLKITAAQTAMNAFLDKIQISNTVSGFQHQVGFVKFPQDASNQNFNDACEGDNTNHKLTYFSAVQDQVYSAMSSWRPLGTSIATVKSDITALSPANGTAMALGLIKGREIVLGTGHNSNNVPVIILATDGMPNVLSSTGRTTGWNGLLNTDKSPPNGTNVKPLGTNPDGTTTYPNCNATAATETYAAATAAKNAGVLIFTIATGATGTDFDSNVIKAIATPNGGGKTYYFTAGDSNALNAAYNSIAKIFTDLGGTCSIQQKLPQRAPNALLTIKKPDGTTFQVVTLANGEFIVSDVAPGRYEITAVTYNDSVTGLPYTKFTDGPGGADITNPIIIVGDTADTYRTDTFIRTLIDPCQ